MAQCKNPDEAFVLASQEADPMNVVAVLQHTAGEYLGLVETISRAARSVSSTTGRSPRASCRPTTCRLTG